MATLAKQAGIDGRLTAAVAAWVMYRDRAAGAVGGQE